MTISIFDHFKESIECVRVKKVTRGSYESPTTQEEVELHAIVKRRKGMGKSLENSEDYKFSTTVHFKPCDKEYIKIGNFVNIDGNWHSIDDVRNGKDFNSGEINFIYAKLADDILPEESEPVWPQILAA